VSERGAISRSAVFTISGIPIEENLSSSIVSLSYDVGIKSRKVLFMI